MNKFDLIVFDLDGTLLSSIEDIAHAYRLACRDFGFIEPPTLEVTRWVGQGHLVAVNNCFAWLKRELLSQYDNFPVLAGVTVTADNQDEVYNTKILALKDDFLALHKKLYISVGNTHSTLFPGVIPSLARLQQAGVKLAVLTNKMKALTPIVLEDLDIAKYFDQVYSDGDLQNNKPHPEGILRLMQEFNLTDKDRVLMVGDSENDINAGKAAGVKTLGLTYGYNYDIPISASRPSYICDHFCGCVALNEGIFFDSKAFTHLIATLEK